MTKLVLIPATTLILVVLFALIPKTAETSQADQHLPTPIANSSSTSPTAFDPMPEMSPASGYLARVMMNSPEDLEKALKRAEQLYDNGKVSSEDAPLAFVIHGPEVEIFFKNNYKKYKSIVDLAAKLSAFKVVDVRVCERRMGSLGRQQHVLPPFVSTVPFGPAEIERLVEEEEYVYF